MLLSISSLAIAGVLYVESAAITFGLRFLILS
jgi:hypothetical protein